MKKNIMNYVIYIPYWNKKIPLKISKPTNPEFKDIEEAIYVECEEAWFYQERDITDLWLLVQLIPDLIERQKKLWKDNVLSLRLSYEDKNKLEVLANKNWYKNISSYARAKILQSV
jgi:hypothetical protein